MRTKVIHPITTSDFCPDVVSEFGRAARTGHEIDCEFITTGPPTVECYLDEAYAIPGVLAVARRAERENYDAVIVNCAADPGLYAVREALSIPAIGPSQTAMHLASQIAFSFSVIAVQHDTKHMFGQLARMYGLDSKLASIRSLGLTVLQLQEGHDALIQSFAREIEQAVTEDGAHAIVLGCTALVAVLDGIRSVLRDRRIYVPVIDSVAAAVKMAEMMYDLGIGPSALSYPTPPPRAMAGYDS